MRRTPRSATFKKKVALEVVREKKTLAQIASEHDVHSMQVTQNRLIVFFLLFNIVCRGVCERLFWCFQVNFINKTSFLSCAVYSGCLVGGYAFNIASVKANRLAVKNFSLRIDIQRQQDYNTYVNSLLEYNRFVAMLAGVSLARQLGALLCDCTVIAIREEFAYRFLLERVMLPPASSRFLSFSIGRTCISSVIFAASHLSNPFSREELAGQFFNTLGLGVVCSLVQEKIGLFGSILVHCGYNLYGWQYMYNQNFIDTIEGLREVQFQDIFNREKIKSLAYLFWADLKDPFVLAFNAARMVMRFCFAGQNQV